MTNKNDILVQGHNKTHKSPLTLTSLLYLPLVITCMLMTPIKAEKLLENLDPLSLLESSLEQDSENVNTSSAPVNPNALSCIWEPRLTIANLLPGPWQTQANNNIAVNFAAQINKKSNHLLIAKNPTTSFSRKLWQTRIANPDDKNIIKSRNELLHIIEKIRSLKFETEDKPVEPVIAIEPPGKTETDKILPHIDETQKPEAQKSEATSQGLIVSEPQEEKHFRPKQITKKTLEIFEEISQNPGRINDPLELAEILFHSGNLKEAAICYQEALNRISNEQTEQNPDKAWILFQTGNCLRNDDPSKANEMYRQLIIEFRDSPWADPAMARSNLINWYQQDKPETLIAENRF
jgi:tetratricopeptide (TPR) repeat protein